MIHPTGSPESSSHSAHRPSPDRIDQATIQNSFVRFVITLCTLPSQADIAIRTRAPTVAPSTNTRTQWKIAAPLMSMPLSVIVRFHCWKVSILKLFNITSLISFNLIDDEIELTRNWHEGSNCGKPCEISPIKLFNYTVGSMP